MLCGRSDVAFSALRLRCFGAFAGASREAISPAVARLAGEIGDRCHFRQRCVRQRAVARRAAAPDAVPPAGQTERNQRQVWVSFASPGACSRCGRSVLAFGAVRLRGCGAFAGHRGRRCPNRELNVTLTAICAVNVTLSQARAAPGPRNGRYPTVWGPRSVERPVLTHSLADPKPRPAHHKRNALSATRPPRPKEGTRMPRARQRRSGGRPGSVSVPPRLRRTA